MATVLLLSLGGGARVAFADVFSPGDLSKSHASLSGISNCTECHASGSQLSQATCLTCHVELKTRVANKTGFHGLMPNEKRECESCHSEHQGVNFKLVDWGSGGKKAFDHQQVGWSLKGKHQKTECDDCHDPKHNPSTAIQQLMRDQPGRLSYLGLKTACTSCHYDEHRGQTEGTCDSCHDEKGWKPAPLFDHADTTYELKGKHAKVECDKCHLGEQDVALASTVWPAPKSETFMRFAPVTHKLCTDCHEDVHNNKFGQRCTSCHSEVSWKVIRNAVKERAFHDNTRYPLKGEHLDVDCRSCHGPFPGKPPKFKNMAFKQCTDCHSDAHEGQMTLASGQKLPVCEDCHSVEGFTPVRFTLAQHQKTPFQLEGSHQMVGCTVCHVKSAAILDKVPKELRLTLKKNKRQALFSAATFDFAKGTDRCETCHADVHEAQFKNFSGGCAQCHTSDSFHKLKFDHDRDSSFALNGKHETAKCSACHAPEPRAKAIHYKPLPQTCVSCHADIHAGQFAKGGKNACETCHTESSFKSPLKFQHAPPFTTYLLDGKHAEVACVGCHPALPVASAPVAGLKTVQKFKGVPTTCEGCHSDFHKGAFKGFEP